MFITFTSLSGLVGYSNSWTIPTFLIGCFFAFFLMWWPDPQTPIMYRKITLISFFIITLVYFLIFLSYEHNLKLSIYSASIYVILYFTKGIHVNIYIWNCKRYTKPYQFQKVYEIGLFHNIDSHYIRYGYQLDFLQNYCSLTIFHQE